MINANGAQRSCTAQFQAEKKSNKGENKCKPAISRKSTMKCKIFASGDIKWCWIKDSENKSQSPWGEAQDKDQYKSYNNQHEKER